MALRPFLFRIGLSHRLSIRAKTTQSEQGDEKEEGIDLLVMPDD